MAPRAASDGGQLFLPQGAMVAAAAEAAARGQGQEQGQNLAPLAAAPAGRGRDAAAEAAAAEALLDEAAALGANGEEASTAPLEPIYICGSYNTRRVR